MQKIPRDKKNEHMNVQQTQFKPNSKRHRKEAIRKRRSNFNFLAGYAKVMHTQLSDARPDIKTTGSKVRN